MYQALLQVLNIVVNKIVPAFMELIVHKWVGKGVDTQIINDNYIE